jgi:membrane protease YdiL (CAAX protease family)
MGRPAAAVIVGVVWAVWHLPLFVLPGAGQYGTNFPIFALGVVGLALALAWLYGGTRSIFLCVMFHAAYNAVLAMGLAVPTSRTVPALADGALRLVVGAALVVATRRRFVSA